MNSLRFLFIFFFSLTNGQCSKRQTVLSVLAVHRPFYISICIFTLPTQHTMFISCYMFYQKQMLQSDWFRYFYISTIYLLRKIINQLPISNVFFPVAPTNPNLVPRVSWDVAVSGDKTLGTRLISCLSSTQLEECLENIVEETERDEGKAMKFMSKMVNCKFLNFNTNRNKPFFLSLQVQL